MSPPLLERFSRFLEHADRSPLTVRNYLADLAAFSRWFEDANQLPLDPAQITATDLREYKRQLLENQRLKPASVNRKLATLKSFLGWAAGAGLTTEGHLPKVPRLERLERLGPRWLDRREQHSLLRAVERGGSLRDLAIVKLLLNTGLRVGELCALTWLDVHQSDRKGTLTVRRGKGGKRREIPLNKDARSALLGAGYTAHLGKSLSLFLGQRGPLTPRGVQILLARYLKTANLDHASPHTLRHSFCKNLVDAGVSLEQVAALAGHESLDVTRRYCEPSFADLERAVERIGEED